ncbi:hypothetical protein NCF86_03345 [Pelagerythrobacter marinus]|nr:hypothetical protein NCF86_03345 [Pelagerythrobacter marinus]
MRLLALILPVALAACASTQDVLHKEPDRVFHSEKPVDEVVRCIARVNGARVREAADGSKFVQIKNGWQGITLLFLVKPEGEGSRIELKKFYPLGMAAHKQCY